MATTLVRVVCCRFVTGFRPAAFSTGSAGCRQSVRAQHNASGHRAWALVDKEGRLLKSKLTPAGARYVSTSKPAAAAAAAGKVDVDDIVFRQLFDQRTCTYTYLLADRSSRDAVFIDPVQGLVERDVRILKDLDLTLIYGVNTHVHADHVTGTGDLKATISTCKSVIAAVSKAEADVKIKHGDVLKFGKFALECRSTPGHTNGCMTYVFHEKEMAFTGDALLIRGCGRTDFQEGCASTLYESVHTRILSLPPQFRLYPGHDYTGQTVTTVEEEKRCNPRLTRTKEDFIKIMTALNLPHPRFIDQALPANMVCGIYDAPPEDAKS